MTTSTSPNNDGGALEDLRKRQNNEEQQEDNDESSFSGAADSDQGPAVPSHRAQAALHEKAHLARSESRVVGHLRIYFLLFLGLTAGLAGWGTFQYTHRAELDDFESRFSSIAGSVSESFHDAVERKLGALDAMSVTITSYALQSGESFPMVTLPDFETRGANTRILADGIYVFWLPLVVDEKRAEWEAYTAQRYMHLYGAFGTESMLRAMQDQSFGLHQNRNRNRMLSMAQEESVITPMADSDAFVASRRLQDGAFQAYVPTIWNFQGPQPPGSGPFFPLWQVSPVIPLVGLLNFNFIAFEGDGLLLELQSSKRAIIGGVALNLTDPDAEVSAAQNAADTTTEDLITAFLQLGQYRHDAASFESDPLTPVAYPVFDGFGPDKNLTGALYSAVYWRLLFQDILPADVQGVICVLQNTGGFAEGGANDPPFSFRLDGPLVTFLGVGDLHDPEYESMKITHDVSRYIQERASPRSRAYTTTPFNSEYNTYILDIYPSDAMKDDYVTNKPYLYMGAITGVFLFVLLSFLLYDWFVEIRQRKVMDRAVKSTAVVASLFPDAVRDQMFKEISQDIGVDKKKGKEWEVSDELTRSLEMILEEGKKERATRKPRGKVIASKYDATTVFFMDLAGFTAWSSTRGPEDVFNLLETLYAAYDSIAQRREVFKVETIGDCYMAVTGLPKPQPDHAYRMAKFAVDCQAKTGVILHHLKDSLGKDTLNLSCRIGLHSGPVIAGVLRGDKGRFQLFGDTVNTASRMESTGEKGRIQCSAATAELLRQAGKESWLTSRADKIVAKGKGEMETFWIQATGARGTSVGTASNHNTGISVHAPSSLHNAPPETVPPGIHRRQYPEEMSEF